MIKDALNHTSLKQALDHNHLGTARRILENKSPKDITINKGFVDKAIELLEYCDDNLTDTFCFAAAQGMTDMVKLFIYHGVDIDANESGKVLHYAISTGKLDVVTILLKQGANPNIRFDNQNALQNAVLHHQNDKVKHRDMVKLLLEHGVHDQIPKLGEGDEFGEFATALHLALIQQGFPIDNSEIIKLLVKDAIKQGTLEAHKDHILDVLDDDFNTAAQWLIQIKHAAALLDIENPVVAIGVVADMMNGEI